MEITYILFEISGRTLRIIYIWYGRYISASLLEEKGLVYISTVIAFRDHVTELHCLTGNEIETKRG